MGDCPCLKGMGFVSGENGAVIRVMVEIKSCDVVLDEIVQHFEGHDKEIEFNTGSQ